MASSNKLVTLRSEAWVCGLSYAGIGGSNPAGGMDVCLLLMCFGQLEGADPSSRGVLLRACVIECDQVRQQPSTPTKSR
jgi:hypothetical protein